MKPHRSRPLIAAIIALLLSALYVVGLAVDWPAWIHGSNWVWVRRVPEPGWRVALLPLALAAGMALAWWAAGGGGWSQRRTALLLGVVAVLTPLAQLVVAAQHRAQPLSLVVLGASGFWQEGAHIDAPLAFAREHVARMPGYDDVHVRTQPPGWPLAYWAAGRAFARAPALADAVGRRIHRFDCLSPEMAGLDTAQLAAGSLRVAILVLSGLGALPLYAIGRRFFGPGAARAAAVGYAYLPALLVFSGRFDVAYALLALVAVWLALRAALDGQRGAGVALAVVVSMSSFFTFTALPIAGLALLVVAVCGWAGASEPAASDAGRSRGSASEVAHSVGGGGNEDAQPRHRTLWGMGWLRRMVWLGAGVGVALLLFWGGLWLLGIDGWAMWRVGQAIHREYRLNYPAFFLFNLFDLAVFMGIMPFVGAVWAVARGPLPDPLPEGEEARGRGVALGWAAAVLLLNLTATVRAETGRLWLFLMPLGLLVGLGWFAEAAGNGRRGGRAWFVALFGVFVVQALATGFFLGGRAAEPATPPPVWRMPVTAQSLDYRLGDAVALRGYDLTPTGDGARLTLYWQALDFPRAEASAFVHALRGGEIAGQSDGPPAAVPMWCWVPGEVVADERLLGAPGGFDAVGVGLYDPLSGARLPVWPAVAEDRIVLP